MSFADSFLSQLNYDRSRIAAQKVRVFEKPLVLRALFSFSLHLPVFFFGPVCFATLEILDILSCRYSIPWLRCRRLQHYVPFLSVQQELKPVA